MNNLLKLISLSWRELISNDRLYLLHLQKLNWEAMRLMHECERLEFEFKRLIANSESWNGEYEQLKKLSSLKGENEAVKDENFQRRYIKLRATGRIRQLEIKRFKKDIKRLFADRDRLTISKKRLQSGISGMRLFLFG